MTEHEAFDMLRFYEEMVAQDSDAFTFAVRRSPPESGRTLSAEAMEQMKEVFGGFLAARLSSSLRKRGPKGKGHSEVRMDLRLWIDGESIEVPDDLHPWYGLVDGEHRGGA